MKPIRRWLRRLSAIVSAARRERDLADEIDSHLQLHIDDNLRAGMTPAEARRQALIKFGPLEAIKDDYRDRRGFPLVTRIAQDTRFAVRLLRKAPALSAAVIVTTATAVGINAGTFAIVNAAVFRPLRVPEGDRLITLSLRFSGHGNRNVHGDRSMLSAPEFELLRAQTRAFEHLTAFAPFNEVTVGTPQPRRALATLVSCEYFDVVESVPTFGRGFSATDCAPGAPPTLVLSDRLWRSAFDADPGILGRAITINRSAFVVIGVAPPGFTGTQVVYEDLFVPLTTQRLVDRERHLVDDPDMSWLIVIGRLRPAASRRTVDGELPVISGRLTAAARTGLAYHLEASRATLTIPGIRSFVLGTGAVLLGAVGLVLLLACANIANLLLARSMARRREMAVRLAMGAGRGRLIQQLLTESLLLAAIGGVLGSVAATWSARAAVRLALAHLPPGSWPLVFEPRPDARVFLYAFALTTLTGVAFGLAPALQGTSKVTGDLREARGTDRRSTRRAQVVLVTVQVATSMVLVLTAGLLLRGLYRADTIDPGVAMGDVAVLSYDLSGSGYAASGAVAFQEQVRERLAAMPGIRAAAGTTAVPLSDQHSETTFRVGGDDLSIEFARVTPEFFDVMRIPLVRGRTFTRAEAISGAAAIVTESTAQRLWPGVDAVGQALTLERVARPVVGVVQDAHLARLGTSDNSYVFLPPDASSATRMHVLVAARSGKPNLPQLRETVQALDHGLVVDAQRLEDNLEQWRAPSRLACALAALLAIIALVLASTGVFAAVAYGVSRRAREIGIRVALGAAYDDVLRLIVRQGMVPVVAGIGLGTAAAAATSKLFASLLFGVSPLDPLAFVGVPLALAVIALAACYIPARRALTIAPTDALRAD